MQKKSLLFLFALSIFLSCALSDNEDPRAITVFAFKSRHNPQLDTDIFGNIQYVAKSIQVIVPGDIDRTRLIAYFNAGDSPVFVHGKIQESGITENDFSAPLVYEVGFSNQTRLKYTVTVSLDTRSFQSQLEVLSNHNGCLFPRFSPETKDYTLYQLPSNTNDTLFFSPQDPFATRILSPFMLTNSNSILLPLTNHSFRIEIEVLAEDRVSKDIYTLNIVPLTHFQAFGFLDTFLFLTNPQSTPEIFKQHRITHLLADSNFYPVLSANPANASNFLNQTSLNLFDHGIIEWMIPLSTNDVSNWQIIDSLLSNRFTETKRNYLLFSPSEENQVSNWLSIYHSYRSKIAPKRLIPVLSSNLAFSSNLNTLLSNIPQKIALSPRSNTALTLDFLFQSSEYWQSRGWIQTNTKIWLFLPIQIQENSNWILKEEWIDSVSNQIHIWKQNFPSLELEGILFGNNAFAQ